MSIVKIRPTRETAAESPSKLVAGLAIVLLTILELADVSPKFLVEVAAGFLCVGALLGPAARVSETEPVFLRASSEDTRGRRRQ